MSNDAAATSAQVRERLAAVMAVMGDQLPAISRAMHQALASAIPELDGDALLLDLLRASSESNVETFFHVARYDIPVDEIDAPPAALEYARRLAQRGVSSHALQRAYRLGQVHVMRLAQAEIVRTENDPVVALGASAALLDLAFAYVDAVTERVVAEYERERERWTATRTTVRASVLRRLLAGDEPDVAGAEQALGYRLRQHHVAVVAWSGTPGAPATAPAGELGPVVALEEVVVGVARRHGIGAPLLVAQDRSVVWGWIPLGQRADGLPVAAVAEELAGRHPHVRLAAGSCAAALPGFVTSHREALRAHLVATTAGEQADPVTSWADPGVRSAALLARDVATARDLVAATLGPLAVADEGVERLRETLRVFLEERRSFVAAAERLHVHRNTVKYRVDRALELRGRGIDEHRLDLELSLLACRWLKGAVLTGVVKGDRGAP